MAGKQADEHHLEPVIRPTLRIVLAIEAEELGERVARSLKGPRTVGPPVHRVDSAHAAPSSVDPGTDLLVLAMDEIDRPLSAWLRAAGDKGLRTLLLVEEEEAVDLGMVAGMRHVGFAAATGLDGRALSDALRRVAAGELPMPAKLAHRLLHSAAESAARAERRALPRLTPREQQALLFLVEGLSNKQLARRLQISDHGAKRLVTNILAKLDCPNRTQAVAFALREGLYEQCVRRAAALAHAPSVRRRAG